MKNKELRLLHIRSCCIPVNLEIYEFKSLYIMSNSTPIPTPNPEQTTVKSESNTLPATTESNTELNKLNLSETIGGSKTRKYLNETITPHLLNGMRLIAVEKPDDPLRALGDYLIKQSEILKNAGSSET